MVASMANAFMTFYSRTSFILDSVSADGAVPLDQAPASDSYFQVTIQGGTVGAGTVEVSGVGTDGGSQSETITFSGNSTKSTRKKWKSGESATITCAGFSDDLATAKISVESIGASGQPQLLRKLLAELRPCRASSGTGRWPALTQGTTETATLVLYLDREDVWEPAVGGIVVDTLSPDEWLIDSVDLHSTGIGRQRWKLRCRKYNP